MSDYQQKVSGPLNERMRLIRLRRKKERLHFWQEFRIVPKGLIWTVVALFLVAQIVAYSVNHWNFVHYGEIAPPELHDEPGLAYLAIAGFVTLVSLVSSIFIFLIGYVNRDAKRRGMNSGLWTLLVIVLLPAWTFVGFLIYFLMREPMLVPLPAMRKARWRPLQLLPQLQMQPAPQLPQLQMRSRGDGRILPLLRTGLGERQRQAAQRSPTSRVPQVRFPACCGGSASSQENPEATLRYFLDGLFLDIHLSSELALRPIIW